MQVKFRLGAWAGERQALMDGDLDIPKAFAAPYSD